MSKPPRPKLGRAQLREAYKHDLAAAWNYARRRHPDHTPYAFVLYGIEGGPPRLSPHVLTEESLTQVARRYVDKGHHDTLDEARDALRYSVADSPLLFELDDYIRSVDALVSPHAATLDETAGYALLAKAAMDALAELDADGLFGSGADRERLLLVIITEDTEEEWSDRSARRLNPKPVFQRFHNHLRIEGDFASCEALVIATDGRSIYTVGCRHNPDGKPGNNEFLSEIVAYDVGVMRLSRRWDFSFPSFGDSSRWLACSSDGVSLFVLRCKMFESGWHGLVMRFLCDSGKLIQHYLIPGEPSGFTLSPDGCKLAITMQNRILHFLDSSLHTLSSHEIDVKPYGLRFLRSGELLMATDTGLYRFDPAASAVALCLPLNSFRLVADEAEQLLAVSRWFPLGGPERDHPADFGVHLLHLPAFELFRTFLIPGQQAVKATLSSDGRLLAFEAKETGKFRRFIAVFDTATGQEVARRRCELVNDLAFLPDNRTLAIAISEHTTTQPIDLWRIPGP